MKIKKMKLLKFMALPTFLGYSVLANMGYSFALMILLGFVAVTALQFMYVTD